MADNTNIGYGVKISELPIATNIKAEDYTVLVQNPISNPITRRATISQMLSSVGNNSVQNEKDIEALRRYVMDVLAKNLDSTLLCAITIGEEVSQLDFSVNGSIGTINSFLYESFDGNNGGISSYVKELSAVLSSISGPLSDLISDPEMIAGLSNLIQKYGKSDLSDDIYKVDEKVDEVSAKILTIQEEITDLEDGAITDLCAYSVAVNERIDDNWFGTNLQRLTTLKPANGNSNLFNPINVEKINPSYEYYDSHCFANTPLENGTHQLSDDGSVLLSAEEITEGTIVWRSMPGTADFDIDGIPLRAGMFSVDNNIASLEFSTKGNSTVDIYLNNASFDSSGSFKTGVYLNNNKIYSNTNSASSASDMKLVWAGKLESKSTIRFETPLTGSITLDQHKLVGAIIPRLDLADSTPIGNNDIEVLSAGYPQNSIDFIVDCGINNGYNKQTVPLSIVLNLTDDTSTTINDSMELTTTPRVNYLNTKRVTISNASSNISSVYIVGYDDIRQRTITSYTYAI